MTKLLAVCVIALCLVSIIESKGIAKRGRTLSFRLRQKPSANAKNVRTARRSSLRMHDVYGANLAGQENSIAYEVKISLGDTFQAIPVTISTAFSGLWVPQKGCANKGENSRFCPAQGAYDPALSKTTKKIKNGFKKDRVQTGMYRSDSFAFGTKKCEHQMMKLKTPIVFGAATQTTNGDQGVLGLGLPNPTADGPLSSVFDQMIKDGLLDAPIFTTMYKPCADASGCKKAGLLTLGGVDANSCEDIENWFPLPAAAKQWSVAVEKWQLNKYKFLKPTAVVLDPSSTHIQLPMEQLTAMSRQTGASFANGKYTIECDKAWNLQLFVGGQEFTIGHDKLTKSDGSGKCDLLLQKSSGQWVLGAPFAQTYCIAHNFEKKEVGFAKIK